MRDFLRCQYCLYVHVVEATTRTARCPCGGTAEFIGHARSRRVSWDSFSEPCGTSCWRSVSPFCSCVCRGQNHGRALVSEVVPDLADGWLIDRPATAEQWSRKCWWTARRDMLWRVCDLLPQPSVVWKIQRGLASAAEQTRWLARVRRAEFVMAEWARACRGLPRELVRVGFREIVRETDVGVVVAGATASQTDEAWLPNEVMHDLDGLRGEVMVAGWWAGAAGLTSEGNPR